MIDIEDKKYSVKTMSDYLGGYGWWRAGNNVGDESRLCELVRFDDDGGYAPAFSVVLPKNEGQTFKKFGMNWSRIIRESFLTSEQIFLIS
nr:hypothetical protein [Acetobacter persici]